MFKRLLLTVALLLVSVSAPANTWFPRLSPDGKHVISGAGVLSLDESPMGITGWAPDWCDSQNFIFNAAQDGLRLGNIGQVATKQLDSREFSEISCGGAIWAGRFTARNALIVSDGREIPNAGQPSVSDTGFLVFRTGDDRIEPSASNTCAAWGNGGGQIFGFNPTSSHTPINLTTHGLQEYRPVCLDTPAGPWLLTMDQTRLMLRPFISNGMGFVTVTGPDRNLNSHAIFADNQFKIVYNDSRGRLLRWNVPATSPLVSLLPDVTPPPPPPPPQTTNWSAFCGFLRDNWGATTKDAEALHQLVGRWHWIEGHRTFGLLHKPGGSNHNGFSEDWIVEKKADNLAWGADVIGGMGGPNPTVACPNSPDREPNPQSWREPPVPGGTTPPPPPPADDIESLKRRIAELERIAEHFSGLSEQLRVATERVAALEAERDDLKGQLTRTQEERDQARNERDEARAALANVPTGCRAIGGPGWIRNLFGISCELIR